MVFIAFLNVLNIKYKISYEYNMYTVHKLAYEKLHNLYMYWIASNFV